jgi:hypothetical protein
VLVVSEPPTDEAPRWTPAVLTSTGLVDEGRFAGVRRLRRR